MKISWKWLSSLVNLEGLTPQEIGDRLTMSGLELEEIIPFAQESGLQTVVVAQIKTMEQHPNADKLSVCMVDAGPHGEKQIVCGAKNMGPGDKVPLAMTGTRLPDGQGGTFKIKKSKLRGVVSEGMLCAEDELGLGEGHDGLMILPADLELGQPVVEALSLADTVLDVAVTPNRPDALSHCGVSRDVAVLTGRDRQWPTLVDGWRRTSRGETVELPAVPWEGLAADAGEQTTASQITVEIQDKAGCPRYAAALLSGIKVGPSPQWMQNRLRAIGQRPINNLVDVTNLVLHECGQPLHAFDADKVADGHIIVRRAQEGETLETLDGKERKLLKSDLVIADPSGPIALAGVMGGASTEVSDETTRVIIECASFNPSPVRKTARRLALHSESSYRFGRGVDPAGVPWFIRRAVELIVETQAALGVRPQVAPGVVDVSAQAVEPTTVALPLGRYAQVMGVDLALSRQIEVLDALDLVAVEEGDALQVRVPTFRPDIERAVDLIEEIARIEGFDSVEAVLPSGTMGFAHGHRDDSQGLNATLVPVSDANAVQRVCDILLGHGLREVVNYNFVDHGLVARLGYAEGDVRRHPIRVRNPLGVEDSEANMDAMRTSLLPGLLTNLHHNRKQRVGGVNLFEIGHVYLRRDLSDAPVSEDVGGNRWETHVEPLTLGVLLADAAATHHTGQRRWDLHDLRALAETVVRAVTRRSPRVVPYGDGLPSVLHPYAVARVEVDGVSVGTLGALHPAFLAEEKLKGEVFVMDLDLSRLLSLRVVPESMTPLPKHPASQRDFALAMSQETTYAEVEDALTAFGDDRLVGYELVDVYQGEQLGEGRKSLAIRVTFRAADATLGEDDLQALESALTAHLVERLDAERR